MRVPGGIGQSIVSVCNTPRPILHNFIPKNKKGTKTVRHNTSIVGFGKSAFILGRIDKGRHGL